MANFPTAVTTFATRSAGQSIASAHMNAVQDEINAIEDGYLNGTARLNSSHSTIAALSVSGGSTFAGKITGSSGLSITGNSTVAALQAGASTVVTLQAGGSTFAQPATGSRGVIFNAIAGATVPVTEWHQNSSIAGGFYIDADECRFLVGGNIVTGAALDLGNNKQGPSIEVLRNANAGSEGPAAGSIRMFRASGGENYIWPDNSGGPGQLRINTAPPTGSAGSPTVADTAGTVIGTQTSWHAVKDVHREHTDRQGALDAILQTRVYDFSYKESGYRDEQDQPAVFTGVVIHPEDRSKWFAMNVGRQQIPALNEINAVGYFILAIQQLKAEIETLKAQRDGDQ